MVSISFQSGHLDDLRGHLKNSYRTRNKVPVIPWAAEGGNFVTFDIDEVFIEPELKVFLTTPDLPLCFSVSIEELFTYEGKETAMRPTKRFLIRGRAGSGKTTLLLKLSSDWANGKKLSPDRSASHISVTSQKLRSRE